MFGKTPPGLIVDGAAGIAAETLDLRDVAAQPFPCDLPYGAEPVGQPRRHRAGERRQVRHRNLDVEKLDAAGRLTASAEMAVRQAAITYTGAFKPHKALRSEEHTSELQSLMRISYAVFCLTKK